MTESFTELCSCPISVNATAFKMYSIGDVGDMSLTKAYPSSRLPEQ